MVRGTRLELTDRPDARSTMELFECQRHIIGGCPDGEALPLTQVSSSCRRFSAIKEDTFWTATEQTPLHLTTDEPRYEVQHPRIRVQHLPMVLVSGNSKSPWVHSLHRGQNTMDCLSQAGDIMIILPRSFQLENDPGNQGFWCICTLGPYPMETGKHLRLIQGCDKTGDTSCFAESQANLASENPLCQTPKLKWLCWETIYGLSWWICSGDPLGHFEYLTTEMPWEWLSSAYINSTAQLPHGRKGLIWHPHVCSHKTLLWCCQWPLVFLWFIAFIDNSVFLNKGGTADTHGILHAAQEHLCVSWCQVSPQILNLRAVQIGSPLQGWIVHYQSHRRDRCTEMNRLHTSWLIHQARDYSDSA